MSNRYLIDIDPVVFVIWEVSHFRPQRFCVGWILTDHMMVNMSPLLQNELVTSGVCVGIFAPVMKSGLGQCLWFIWATCQLTHTLGIWPTVPDSPRIHYNDVIMSAMVSQITSLTFVHSTVYSGADKTKPSNKAPRHWPLWGEFTGGRWIPRTKGQ